MREREPRPKQQNPHRTTIMIVVIILVATAAVLAIGFLLLQELESNSAKIAAIKMRKQFDPAPVVDALPLMERKETMEVEHPLCEKLYRETEQMQNALNYAGAASAYGASAKQYLRDVGSRKLDSTDHLHLAVRYHSIS